MIETLRKLQAIQEIDQTIQTTDGQRREHEAALEQLQNDTAKRNAILARLEQTESALAHKRAGLELELKTREAQREKFNKQTMMVKTAKELDAINHELATVEADISRLEEQLLALMEEEERADADLKAKKTAAEKLASRAAVEAKRLTTLRDEADALLAGLREDRIVALNQLDDEVRNKYERLLKKPGLPVLASLKDDACGGCGAILPAHTGIQVRSDGVEVIQCPRCLRFLLPKV
jgi:uncharacterized protein